MAGNINMDILKKLNEKTKGDNVQKEFIMEILQIESKGLGWFKKTYNDKLDKYVNKEK